MSLEYQKAWKRGLLSVTVVAGGCSHVFVLPLFCCDVLAMLVCVCVCVSDVDVQTGSGFVNYINGYTTATMRRQNYSCMCCEGWLQHGTIVPCGNNDL